MTIKQVFILSSAMFLFALTSIQSASAKDLPRFNFLATEKMESKIAIDGQSYDIAGQISVHMSATDRELEKDVLLLEQANIAIFDFPEFAVSTHKSAAERGVLGFVIDKEEASYVKWDRKRHTLSLTVSGHITLPGFRKYMYPEGDEKRDSFISPAQAAQLVLVIQLDEPLNPAHGEYDLAKISGKIRAGIKAKEDRKLHLKEYSLEFIGISIIIDWTRLYVYKAVKELCVQPVRFSRLNVSFRWPQGLVFTNEYTGEGYNFGLPEARKQWAKADVIFKARSWKTFYGPQHFTVPAGSGFLTSEEQDVIDTVDDSDCIELFFVDTFSPESAHGGGATVMSGTSSAQIITSDRNQLYGIDKVHLAHELGHVMDLAHPGGGTGSLSAASTGSLMCPSGFKNDNPAINSTENKNNINNPLFVFKFAFVQNIGTDCTNSADCGACP